MRVAVTGSSGFIGSNLVRRLASDGHTVEPINRNQIDTFDLEGVDTIIHCAAIAHRRGITRSEYEEINHIMPIRLAERAAAAGVGRFVFVSTINVVAGHKGTLHHQLPRSPTNDYGATKAAAEVGLLAVPKIDTVIARPCLVYGRGAPGNMKLLTKLAKSPAPLPFGRACNKRSFVSISNCVNALSFLASAPANDVVGGVFHLADLETYSTAELVTILRSARGRSAKLLPIPSHLMVAALRTMGLGSTAEQLFGDLVVDSSSLTESGFSFSDGLQDLIEMTSREHPRI